MKDKPLNEKVKIDGLGNVYIYIEDVAEAVAELKEKIGKHIRLFEDKQVDELIDKIFGTFNNQGRSEVALNPLASGHPEDTSNSKGCGKEFINNQGFKINCGYKQFFRGGGFKINLCPKCQEKEEVCANCSKIESKHSGFYKLCPNSLTQKFKKEQEDA